MSGITSFFKSLLKASFSFDVCCSFESFGFGPEFDRARARFETFVVSRRAVLLLSFLDVGVDFFSFSGISFRGDLLVSLESFLTGSWVTTTGGTLSFSFSLLVGGGALGDSFDSLIFFSTGGGSLLGDLLVEMGESSMSSWAFLFGLEFLEDCPDEFRFRLNFFVSLTEGGSLPKISRYDVTALTWKVNFKLLSILYNRGPLYQCFPTRFSGNQWFLRSTYRGSTRFLRTMWLCLLWASYSSWRHQNMARLYYGSGEKHHRYIAFMLTL